ncbi:hypothetical protein HaLaN_11148, partial [Haematococcus lacustris]
MSSRANYSRNTASFSISFVTLAAANQCAFCDHQRKPLQFLLAGCHMSPRTNHSGKTGLSGTGI